MNRKTANRITGQTKETGFQVGVRRTFDVPVLRAWEAITSEAGIKLWLGNVPGMRWEKGETYISKDGTEGEIRVINSGSHLRVTWQPKGWEKPSTIQIRVIPDGERTTISFHQENLAGPGEREEMRVRWVKVLAKFADILK